MSHTSGPWRIRRHYFGDEGICFVPVEIRGGNGKLIVAQYGGLTPFGQEWTVEDIEGNGSLIEAAPDMLKALEGAKWLIESYVSDLAHSEEYQDVVKAIRKAGGEV